MLNKTCNCCGRGHLSVPELARFDAKLEVYYWECSCHSTLMHTPDKERTFALIRSEYENSARVANTQAD